MLFWRRAWRRSIQFRGRRRCIVLSPKGIWIAAPIRHQHLAFLALRAAKILQRASLFNVSSILETLILRLAIGLLLRTGQISADERQKAGVTPEMFRLSIGIEHIDDTIEDLDQVTAM
jgi:Cys/Met metabolism PLP-dependent enzyme